MKENDLNVIEKGGRTLRKTAFREQLMGQASINEAKREEHQKKLAKEMRNKAIDTLKQGEDGKTEGAEQVVKLKEFTSYRSPGDFPSDAQRDFVRFLPIFQELVLCSIDLR